jgi:hypothetical protein
MTLVSLVILILVTLFSLYLLNALEVNATVKRIGRAVIVIVAILFLLQGLGVLPGHALHWK